MIPSTEMSNAGPGKSSLGTKKVLVAILAKPPSSSSAALADGAPVERR
jgi:hypothetical protein